MRVVHAPKSVHAGNPAEGRFRHAVCQFQLRMIPKYWKEPELLDGYVEMWDRDGDLPGVDAAESD